MEPVAPEEVFLGPRRWPKRQKPRISIRMLFCALEPKLVLWAENSLDGSQNMRNLAGKASTGGTELG